MKKLEDHELAHATLWAGLGITIGSLAYLVSKKKLKNTTISNHVMGILHELLNKKPDNMEEGEPVLLAAGKKKKAS